MRAQAFPTLPTPRPAPPFLRLVPAAKHPRGVLSRYGINYWWRSHGTGGRAPLRPSRYSRDAPCKGAAGQPRARALGTGNKPGPNPVGVEQKPAPPPCRAPSLSLISHPRAHALGFPARPFQGRPPETSRDSGEEHGCRGRKSRAPAARTHLGTGSLFQEQSGSRSASGRARVRRGAADPPRSRRNIRFGSPVTDGIPVSVHSASEVRVAAL